MGLPSGPLTFDEPKVSMAKIPMLKPSGYDMNRNVLEKIFGIDPSRFGALPKRIVVSILEGYHYTEQWYSVTGWIYVLEPVAWVPQLKKNYTKEVINVKKSKFNASASVSLKIEAGGSYMGMTASVKSTNEIKFEVFQSSFVKEIVNVSGNFGKVPVHEIFMYPTLRC
ncbi:hypothetical protein Cpir12675_004023 [Ceratocystis pirilliformis]|uniref:Uncharacterized protein n=1 Tax=Ceratocystis pirilliformis TaxID=259994 RepID=A0ABR3YZ48_9PEZI